MVERAGVVVVTAGEMAVAVRAWATPDQRKSGGAGSRAFGDLGPSRWTLVFDTETTIDTGQGLRVGAFQLRRASRLTQAGVFYEPGALTADEVDVLAVYASDHGLAVFTRAEFVDQVFLATAWKRRGLIVGHNLPFDLARLSVAHHPPQSDVKRMRGGFAFTLSADGDASRVQVKRTNAGAAFIRLTIPGGMNPELRNRERGGRSANHHGYFVDTATLGGALLGGRPSLKRLAELLGTEQRKSEADHGLTITAGYLDYLGDDVQVTWECWQQLHARYERYQLPTPPWRIHSEASIGKAHLDKIGLEPFRGLNDWPDEITATVMETYYGGRTECAIRLMPVPGVYVDFTSQYPTVFVLQGLHRFLTAQRVDHRDEDPGRVQRLLDQLTVDQVIDPEFWAGELHALVLIEPDGDRLPTRAKYNARGRDTDSGRRMTAGSYNVGVPYRCGGPAQWYTLADAASSKLMSGKAPRVLAVLRFIAHGPQVGLQPIDAAGDPAYRVDPAREDLIRRLVELRADVRAEQRQARAAGETERAASLDAVQQAMKATANATSYGSAIEMNPVEHRKPVWVTVHQPDGTSYRVSQDRTEAPGRWFHPLIATLVAAGGRLLLAATMRLLGDLGGSYAFCDTDSLFIAATERGALIPCPGGPHAMPNGQAAVKAITWEQVNALVEQFTALDPYTGPDHPKSILKIEAENYDPKTGRQREIECYAIAAKRYGLFIRRPDGTPEIVASGDKRKRSEHGLGHLLPPNAPDPEISDRAWLDAWWEHLLHLELGFTDHPEPSWFDAPAVGRLTVTSQRDIKAFRSYNAGRPYAEQIKPWGFLAIAHPEAHERARHGGPRCLIAPFERDPVRRLQAHWIDRDQPEQPPRRIHTASTPEYRAGSVAVLSYRDYFNLYRRHPESKALDPSDGKPCHPWTRGALQPWHLTATETIRVGKESNRLTDTHQTVDDEDERAIEYPAPTRKCRGCDAPVNGRRQWCSERCRKRASRTNRVVPSGRLVMRCP
jgi:predicted nucleic acid-binding Zn ribbon protein